MSTISNNNNFSETKPGARFHVVRDQERKEAQLNKYLNSCQLYKRVNPECYPKRSELIEEMYEQKKVMKNRACRRKGAKEFNFKKQSANQIISNNKISRKENRNDFEMKLISRRQIQNYAYEESDQE